MNNLINMIEYIQIFIINKNVFMVETRNTFIYVLCRDI